MDKQQLGKLVERVKQGDHAAFEELYSVSNRSVYFTCISLLRNEEDAKDVVQDVYITAYEKINSLNDAEKIIPWINRIAVNKCKKLLMKRTAFFTDVESAGSELTEENENFLPEEYITQKEKRRLVMDIMRNTLSDVQYKTVILYYFNGLSVDEVADIMECPPGTVKYRLSVARAKIRDGVDAYENRSGDKLYSVVGLPLLMRLLYEEAESIDMPDLLQGIMKAVESSLATGATENAAAMEAAGATENAAAMEAAGTTESAAAMGEAAQQSESAAAAQETAQNTAGGAANSIKGGIMEAGRNTLIAKIGIAVAIAAVIAVGVVIFVQNREDGGTSDRGSEETVQEQTSGGGDAQEQASGHGAGDDAQGQTAENEDADDEQEQFSGDWDTVEESGYPPFFLKYGLRGLEEKDLSGVMLYDQFAFGTSLEEMVSSYQYYVIRNYYEYNGGYTPEEFMELAATAKLSAGDMFTLDCYVEQGNYDTNMQFDIYNTTGSGATFWECIENGQFYYESDYGKELFQVFDLPYISGDLADNREALAELMGILGKPSVVSDCRNGYLSHVDRDEEEEFAETVSLGGGQISYDLVYDRGDYILQISVNETCFGSNNVSGKLQYFTRDMYEEEDFYRFSEIEIKDVYDFE